jgi:hypothetical protein
MNPIAINAEDKDGLLRTVLTMIRKTERTTVNAVLERQEYRFLFDASVDGLRKYLADFLSSINGFPLILEEEAVSSKFDDLDWNEKLKWTCKFKLTYAGKNVSLDLLTSHDKYVGEVLYSSLGRMLFFPVEDEAIAVVGDSMHLIIQRISWVHSLTYKHYDTLRKKAAVNFSKYELDPLDIEQNPVGYRDLIYFDHEKPVT